MIIRYPFKNRARVQSQFPRSMPFPCKNFTAQKFGRSVTRPTSVHKLRPGDIDVVGAMGDSLVAGNGALEEFALGTMIENRGVSWCIGMTRSKFNYLILVYPSMSTAILFRWWRVMARISNASQYSEGIQSKSERIFDRYWGIVVQQCQIECGVPRGCWCGCLTPSKIFSK